MPPPFPGTDPYLEVAGLWPDVRHGLISEIQATLNRLVRPKYFARVENRVYLSDDNDPGREFIIPDVRVMARPGGGVVVIPPATDAAVEPLDVVTLLDDEVHDTYITVIDRSDRAVVTVIEVLSPTNKAAGSNGRAAYVEKRREVMRSPTHLVEVDLLRAGVPIFTRERLPDHDYLVHVSRARSDVRRRATVWLIPLRKRLPVIPIPLRGDDGPVQFDLQAVLATVYDRGRTRSTSTTTATPRRRSRRTLPRGPGPCWRRRTGPGRPAEPPLLLSTVCCDDHGSLYTSGACALDWISRAIKGWNVRMTVRGRRTSKFFGDAGHGGRAAALRAAQAYRDELAASRPVPERAEPKPLLVTRAGAACYQVRVPKVGGGTSTTEFSVRLHGPRQARRLAIEAYRTAAERAGLA